MPTTTPYNDLLVVLFNLVLAALLVATTVLMLTMGGKKRRGEKKVFTRVYCFNCGYSLERVYQKGDYVGRVVGRCPKCGGDLVIVAVYEVRPGEREEEKRLLRLVERRPQ